MTAPSIDTGHGSSADADTYRATAQPVVAMSLADHMDRSGRWFSLSDDQPVFVRTVDEDAMKLGDGWVIAPAWRLTEPPARTVHRNVGWFAAFARRHGQHAQADWLDDFVRYGGFNASQQAAVSPAEQVRPLGQRMRSSEEIVRAALCPGDASVFLDGLSRHHLQIVLAQAWVDGAAQGRAIERARAPTSASVSPGTEARSSGCSEPLPIVPDLLEALREIAALPEMSIGPVDDFARGARAARLDAADIAKRAISRAETPTCGGDSALAELVPTEQTGPAVLAAREWICPADGMGCPDECDSDQRRHCATVAETAANRQGGGK